MRAEVENYFNACDRKDALERSGASEAQIREALNEVERTKAAAQHILYDQERNNERVLGKLFARFNPSAHSHLLTGDPK